MIIKHIITLVFIITIEPTSCSIAIDALNQESTLISQYCPKQRYCREGTHVVCMYYDHNHVFGPRCGNPVEVEVTPRMVQHILANINDIRGEVATGKEKGKDDEALPRAYGLMKLMSTLEQCQSRSQKIHLAGVPRREGFTIIAKKYAKSIVCGMDIYSEWDKELAFLAQVLANQCLGGKGDLCRATDRFPNPSQTIAVVRYKYPDWEYVKANNTEKGLNEEKLIFAVNKFFKSSHALKKTVTKEIIMNCPPLIELPDLNLRFYLNLIRGGATHIGCGISAYSKHRMNRDGDSMQNNVQIICNISDSPKSKQSVYNIVPPIPGQGYTERCGCPRGYKETRSCLCERESSFHWTGQQLQKQPEADMKQDSNKKIVNRLIKDQDNDDAMSAVEPKVSVTQGSSEKKDKKIKGIESPHSTSKSRNIRKGNITEEIHPGVKYGENIETIDEFSKITSAITPKKKYVNSKFTQETDDPVMKSSNSQKRKPVLKPAPKANFFEDLIFKVRSYQDKKATTESSLNVVEENLLGNVNEQTVNFKVQHDQHNFAHKRLLSILDSLEQEVKNLKFDDDLKQIFDSKMRKIYENGVNRGQETSSLTPLNKLNKKHLHERRAYLETDTNKSIEDEIDSLRKMIRRWSKGEEKEQKINYIENENDPNQKHNYVAQQLDAYHRTNYVNGMDNSYEDVKRKTAFADHRDYHIIFSDILNGKHNIDRQHGHIRNLQDNFETKGQETLANTNARQTILSKAIGYNLDNYDDEKIVFDRSDINKIIKLREQVERINKKNINTEGRHIDKNKDVNSPGRRSSNLSNRRLQINYPYSRKNKKGEMHQILLRRPSQIDALRISLDQPRQSIYSSEREILMFK